MKKSDTRQVVRQKREQLADAEVATKSAQIVNRLVYYTDWETIKNLHVYVSLPRLHEVDTKPFMEYVKDRHPSINLYHPKAEPKGLDIILVPLVAFDEAGNRIGMGGGYYDRFLKRYPNAHKVGLAFELQKVASIPTEPHDIPLDAVLTEEKVYSFS